MDSYSFGRANEKKLEENFINKNIIDENYPQKDFYEMHVGNTKSLCR